MLVAAYLNDVPHLPDNLNCARCRRKLNKYAPSTFAIDRKDKPIRECSVFCYVCITTVISQSKDAE